MEEWEAVHRQVRDLLGGERKTKTEANARWTNEKLDALFVPIHEALLAGLIDHVGHKLPEKNEYQGPRNRRFKIHPGSALAKKGPQWVMSAQLAQTRSEEHTSELQSLMRISYAVFCLKKKKKKTK